MATKLPKKNFKYTMPDHYKVYKQRRRSEKTGKHRVWDYKTYKGAISDMLLIVARKIIREDYVFILPHKLGRIYVKTIKFKSSIGGIDYQKTKEYGKTIRYISKTFNKIWELKWCVRGVRFKNKPYFVFKAVDSQVARKAGVGKRGLSEFRQNKLKK